MAKATVAISQDFFNSFAALPKSKQNKVMEFLSKFRSNPEANGFNYEKIQNASDPNMRSVRIDDTYRAILIREEGTNVYLLLWVDHHDEAYDWAVRKRCILNHTTGSIQVYETQATAQPEEASSSEEKPLFASLSDDLLQKLGVPEDAIVTPELAARLLELEALHTRVLVNQVETEHELALARKLAGYLHCPVAAGALQKENVVCLC